MRLHHMVRLLAAMALVCAQPVLAQAPWPGKPVTLVVGTPAGGSIDAYARALADQLTRQTGGTFLVDNRSGASGNLSAEHVLKAPADGHTLWITTQAMFTINPSAYPALRWKQSDFKPIAKGIESPLVLVVHPSVKASTAKEFVDLARASPGVLNYGSAGLGSPQQLHSEFFNQLAGLKTNHIPYKGQSQAMTDLVSGQLNYMFSPLQNALPYIQQGRIRALAVATLKRHPTLPQVPTLSELGYGDVDLSNWFAVFAPAGTPPAVVRKLNAAFVKVGTTPEMKAKFNQLGFDAFFTNPEEGTDFMRSELVRWARVAAYAGIKAE